MRASNEHPYSIDCINTCNFALGHNMLFIMQSIFTNWERRLAVRASDERPYRLFWFHNQNKWRSLTAATVY